MWQVSCHSQVIVDIRDSRPLDGPKPPPWLSASSRLEAARGLGNTHVRALRTFFEIHRLSFIAVLIDVFHPDLRPESVVFRGSETATPLVAALRIFQVLCLRRVAEQPGFPSTKPVRSRTEHQLVGDL